MKKHKVFTIQQRGASDGIHIALETSLKSEFIPKAKKAMESEWKCKIKKVTYCEGEEGGHAFLLVTGINVDNRKFKQKLDFYRLKYVDVYI